MAISDGPSQYPQIHSQGNYCLTQEEEEEEEEMEQEDRTMMVIKTWTRTMVTMRIPLSNKIKRHPKPAH